MYFASNLRFLRKKYGYSQEFISSQLGYKSFTTVQKWETSVSEPNVTVLRKIAQIFGISMDKLLNWDLEHLDDDSYIGSSASGQDIDSTLLDICHRLNSGSQYKVLEYAGLLLRDEQRNDKKND